MKRHILVAFLSVAMATFAAGSKNKSAKSQVKAKQTEKVDSNSVVDPRDGQAYKIVKIGTQIWMAENLNYVPTGKESNGALCYNDAADSCAKYGRLYDWATTMNLPSSCNSKECSTQIQATHQGICPTGWHIPTDDEWTILGDFLGGNSEAGTKMKGVAPTWDGDNSSGFAALAAGEFSDFNDFKNAGSETYFWSSEFGEAQAWYRSLSAGSPWLARGYDSKKESYSVRCLQD